MLHEMPETIQNRCRNFLNELKTGRPYQQILGKTEFYGMEFFTDENVLIPRPETEELLELAIDKIKNSEWAEKDIRILDIGTGSGVIAIILKKHFADAQVHAIDYSEKAIETAKKNAAFHRADIKFIHQDYLKETLEGVYDVIVSNPPYIGTDETHEIADSVKLFEPSMALFSPSANPLVFYEKIAADCRSSLSENGMVFLEINQKFGIETRDLFTDILQEVSLVQDLSGNDRFVWGRKTAGASEASAEKSACREMP